MSRSTQILEQSIGSYGANYIANTDANTGLFCAITALETSVVTTIGNIALTTVTVSAGITIYGRFTSVTLASGKVLAYKAGG